MELPTLRIDGDEMSIQSFSSYLAAFVGPDITVGDTDAVLVNRLRSKGYHVETTPSDDGMMDVWTVKGVCGSGSGTVAHWRFVTVEDANSGLRALIESHPDTHSWTTVQERLSCETFRNLNGGYL